MPGTPAGHNVAVRRIGVRARAHVASRPSIPWRRDMSAYRTSHRVHEVLLRLDAGDRGLHRLAADTGFADHSHLTRTFKRFVQVPPSRYLPQNSKNVQDFEATLHDTATDAR